MSRRPARPRPLSWHFMVTAWITALSVITIIWAGDLALTEGPCLPRLCQPADPARPLP
ncbi:hypothetical protein [Actinophytocola xinjiangensis]|uniref:hypothetical protein n=1 Tax=Actinophytocola xinjiangensis TaxID=485602 RepID=UPI000AFE4AD6|nr:hypothetical protein [Actinophytocola xinjiangensis]